ncbi:hypothetical protein BKA70DRAFT_1578005 [Coprinopsis sp. MPI-PUGE-AT-0042]|nr:hypothetical protein BKA70DRAFT_1578005 [Coprinopsis sp. MPI-PUGE-AT-0042]
MGQKEVVFGYASSLQTGYEMGWTWSWSSEVERVVGRKMRNRGDLPNQAPPGRFCHSSKRLSQALSCSSSSNCLKFCHHSILALLIYLSAVKCSNASLALYAAYTPNETIIFFSIVGTFAAWMLSRIPPSPPRRTISPSMATSVRRCPTSSTDRPVGGEASAISITSQRRSGTRYHRVQTLASSGNHTCLACLPTSSTPTSATNHHPMPSPRFIRLIKRPAPSNPQAITLRDSIDRPNQDTRPLHYQAPLR